jgi:hypothetical protein
MGGEGGGGGAPARGRAPRRARLRLLLPRRALRSLLADPRWSPLSAPLRVLDLVAALLYLTAFATAATSAHAGFFLLSSFWSLADTVAVVESTAGLTPLRWSCRLLSGTRLAALFAFFVFAAGVGATLWGFGVAFFVLTAGLAKPGTVKICLR